MRAIVCSNVTTSIEMLTMGAGGSAPGGVLTASRKICTSASNRRWASVRGSSAAVASSPQQARTASQSAVNSVSV